MFDREDKTFLIGAFAVGLVTFVIQVAVIALAIYLVVGALT